MRLPWCAAWGHAGAGCAPCRRCWCRTSAALAAARSRRKSRGRFLARYRLRGDACAHFAAVLAARGARWGYVRGGDAGGCGKWTSRDQSGISGFYAG
jgi:uncharacterized protein YcbX